MANIAAPFVGHRSVPALAAPRAERRKPTLKLFGYGIALLIVAAMVLPFARDVYTRHQVMQRLWPVLSEQDRLSFRNWSGDAISFNRAVYARCLLKHPGEAAACEPLQPPV
ncbi:MAG TPA: hypothetical protein VFW46_01960 [Stellaceae bacterium]|nr:hypothetical protein [Stellaceae bacterium]